MVPTYGADFHHDYISHLEYSGGSHSILTPLSKEHAFECCQLHTIARRDLFFEERLTISFPISIVADGVALSPFTEGSLIDMLTLGFHCLYLSPNNYIFQV